MEIKYWVCQVCQLKALIDDSANVVVSQGAKRINGILSNRADIETGNHLSTIPLNIDSLIQRVTFILFSIRIFRENILKMFKKISVLLTGFKKVCIEFICNYMFMNLHFLSFLSLCSLVNLVSLNSFISLGSLFSLVSRSWNSSI